MFPSNAVPKRHDTISAPAPPGMRRWAQTLATFLDRFGVFLCTVVAFAIPLKLSWVHAILLPSVLVWALAGFPRIKSVLDSGQQILSALGTLLFAVSLASVAGMNFSESLGSLHSFVYMLLTLMFLAAYMRIDMVITAMILGQAVAALHSVLEAGFPSTIPRLFLGKVTESGQLGMILPAACGWLWMHSRNLQVSTQRISIPMIVGFALLFAVGFGAVYECPLPLQWAAVGVFLVGAVVTTRVGRFPHPLGALMICLPVMAMALLVNLKRGPWIGVCVAAAFGLLVVSRRLVPFLIFGVSAVAIFIPPVRERLAETYAHFTLPGGRQVIWSVGADLAVRFPLGLGFHNSRELRAFSAEIPADLTHFHSNFLNFLVEGGIMGLCAYLWFVGSFLYFGWSIWRDERVPKVSPRGRVALGMLCGLLSWQVAGIGEYNFGDTEVLLVALVLIAVLIASRRSERPVEVWESED
jgi:O-antigen ligase